MRHIVTAGPPIAYGAANAVFLALYMDTVIRVTYAANTLVFPTAFVLTASIIFLIRRKIQHWKPKSAALLLAAVLLVTLRVYATHIEPQNLQLRELTVNTGKDHRPFTLLHISDIQSAGIGAYERRAVERIRALNPDLIIHTGDFLQPLGGKTHATELPKLAALFETLSPPLGMFAVEGESDAWIRGATLEELGGMRFVHSEPVEVRNGDLHIRLFGLALAQTRSRSHVPRNLIDPWLAEGPANAITLVAGHRPDYIPHVSDLSIDLCIAGHTHGGQVRLPFYGPIVTSSNVPRSWARGFREVGQTRMNVSAGIGAGHNKGLPSIRFNCPPEMTLVHFVPKSHPENTSRSQE